MHATDTIVFSMFLIFSGAALLSTVALYTRQSILITYILLGGLLGPWGLKLVANPSIIQQTGDVGIIFLLFLLGLELQPQSVLKMFRKSTPVTFLSALVFLLLGYGIALFFHYTQTECLIVGAAMMFSSTIIGLKLLPQTVLQHRHSGEMIVSILLLQDLIAILVLLLLHAASTGHLSLEKVGVIIVSLPMMFLIAYLGQRFVLIKLIERFEKVHEYVFLLSIAWCLAMAQLAGFLGLSEGIGAFLAGVAIAANHPVAKYLAKNLNPLRDFFLVMFFFSIGAQFDFHYFQVVFFPAVLLAAMVLIIKPISFRFLLRHVSETKQIAWEIGGRLGQASEFSLLIAYLASRTHLISNTVSYVIQATTIITFVISSYYIGMRYPTPMAMSNDLAQE